MCARWLLVTLLFAGCGASPPASAESPETMPELLCSGDLPTECGVDRNQCEDGMQPILDRCLREMAALLPADQTDEMRERAVLLATLCSVHVYRQRRALDGHVCSGEEIEPDYQEMCTICSVALGTVQVSED